MKNQSRVLSLVSLLVASSSMASHPGPPPQPHGAYHVDCTAQLSEQLNGTYLRAQTSFVFTPNDFEMGMAEREIPVETWKPIDHATLPRNLVGHSVSMYFHRPADLNADPQVATLITGASLQTQDASRLPLAANWLNSSNWSEGKLSEPLNSNVNFRVGDRQHPATILVLGLSAQCQLVKE